MRRDQKEQVVEELTARLQAADTLLVADYRGLTMPQIDELRSRLLESGARFTVVKNTLTRRAAEAEVEAAPAEEAPAEEPAEEEPVAEEEPAAEETTTDESTEEE